VFVAASPRRWQDCRVGSRKSPDLFSTASSREHALPSASASRNPPTDKAPRHVLPKDLPGGVKHLNDEELERLLTAVIAVQKRRGKTAVRDAKPNVTRNEATPVPLTAGRVNLVRAAFKAGVTPSQIARQFGMSRADMQRGRCQPMRRKRE
jgi:hypothetical protein